MGNGLLPSLVVLLLLGWLTDSLMPPERLAVLLLIFFAVVTPAHQWLVHRAFQAPCPRGKEAPNSTNQRNDD